MIARMNMHRVEVFGLEARYAVGETKPKMLPNGETKNKKELTIQRPQRPLTEGVFSLDRAEGCVRPKSLIVFRKQVTR